MLYQPIQEGVMVNSDRYPFVKAEGEDQITYILRMKSELYSRNKGTMEGFFKNEPDNLQKFWKAAINLLVTCSEKVTPRYAVIKDHGENYPQKYINEPLSHFLLRQIMTIPSDSRENVRKVIELGADADYILSKVMFSLDIIIEELSKAKREEG